MAQRTWWHLEASQRKPSDYDIATGKLLYYPARGFEVRTPAGQWLLERQRACPLVFDDWDRFHDPRETTYAKYTALQNTKEIFVDALLRSAGENDYDRRLTPEWLATLDAVLGPLLYPAHGLQMVTAYLGHLAPSGRLVVACAFQTADTLRTVQRLAHRIRQLRVTHPDLGRAGKAHWQEHPMWQPLRRAVERLLVTYDWGEALTALNLVLKPLFDALFLVELGRLADRSADEILAKLLGSLAEDSRWHQEWTRSLFDLCFAEAPRNAEVVQRWVEQWRPLGVAAIEPFAAVFGSEGPSTIANVLQAQQRLASALGLGGSAS